MVNIWKWRNASFPIGCRKSFSGLLLEIQEVQGNGHFQTSRVISTTMRAGYDRRTSWAAHGARGHLPPPLLIEDIARPFNRGCCDHHCFPTSFGPLND
jgi:hypothetical protein